MLSGVETDAEWLKDFVCKKCKGAGRPPLPTAAYSHKTVKAPTYSGRHKLCSHDDAQQPGRVGSSDSESIPETIPTRSWSSGGYSVAEPTCLKSRVQSLMWLLQHWNTRVEWQTCCPFHAAVESLRPAYFVMQEVVPCDPLWASADWKCNRCHCLNFRSSDSCVICNLE
eukprot:gnl/TRDRNA2_/TRDRNA2_153424_c0_seq1.p1 gnl/TRDRNA2_/TRDRNA2_153424_c0~~gnl/TRDRNA2_/TRDRNA2_153424_c0_seq1.p1  ORF type:complete len:169 (+),score=6.24 gnl/TRDRNA2_/TRDRNA2_153424_c0_seq1:3-509(+)